MISENVFGMIYRGFDFGTGIVTGSSGFAQFLSWNKWKKFSISWEHFLKKIMKPRNILRFAFFLIRCYCWSSICKQIISIVAYFLKAEARC
jgi:hypothetical protein